ncbi:MAG: alpha/beta fold hydrolase [Candidatus Cyclobacteriaceae bacterium M3_2C_046]
MEFSWINKEEYPFENHYFQLAAGKMHFLDEGQGENLLFLHGNPAWSFTYRKLIKALSQDFRCLAPDYLGFGLSDKPSSWSYLPRDHAVNLRMFIEDKVKGPISLIMNDWGGPLGFHYAVNHPEKIKKLIIFNTWSWSVKGDPHFESFSRFLGSFLGRGLIKYFNFFARQGLKTAFGQKQRLNKMIHQHYYKHLARPNDRKGCWTFPPEVVKSDQWLKAIESKLHLLSQKPVLIAWGMKDIAFRQKELSQFKAHFPQANVIKLDDCGHFVQEEMGDVLVKPVRDFLLPDPPQ